jgi:hypothetical protein
MAEPHLPEHDVQYHQPKQLIPPERKGVHLLNKIAVYKQVDEQYS